MKVLIACEESQAVCKAFREKGHEAYSCDIQPCSGGHPEWHIQDDVLKVINQGWDMMIAHPPCTYLSFAGNRWFNIERYGEKAIERHKNREDAIEFFKQIYNAPIPKKCIENPRGYIQKIIRPTQSIHPYYFGDECSKHTLLWLVGLPKLIHSKEHTLFNEKTHVYKGAMSKRSGSEMLFGSHSLSLPIEERRKLRSKTFPGVAKAMAEQWG